ncbi:MAG TPA: aldo/keto reductase [Candidatus Acidoferrales bacterium]|nr:aldo/keto reductase [Candidatus Acidoferrales bacterium]
MDYRRLGHSGLKVSALGLGTNNFGERLDERASVRVLHAALDLGINFIDTANRYGDGQSEEFIGKALKGRRRQALVATKFGRATGEGANDSGGSRYHIMQAVEASLRRLATDYIDVYQMHVADPETPIEETLRALDDLIRQGKVIYIGCSGFAAWELCEAIWTARMANLHSFVSVQPPYNLLEREIENELLPCCRRYNIGIIPYRPLAAGFLTGKYRPGEPIPPGTRFAATPRHNRFFGERNFSLLAKLERFAAERDHTVGELAIAWLLANDQVSTVIAGASSPEQLSANLRALDWKLTADELKEIDTILDDESS